MNIELTGLTSRQHELLNIMWEIGTIAELNEWRKTLSKSDHESSVTLEHMLVMEVNEPAVEKSTIEACIILAKIMAKK